MKDYITVPERLLMISGQGVQASNKYHTKVGSSGARWFWAAEINSPASYIYVDTHDPKSDGFGGAVLTFETDDGTFAVKGPWHANSNALLKDTGVDLTYKHLTWGVIAKHRGGGNKYYGILHADTTPVVGNFDRITEGAQKLANDLGHPVAYYQESYGGSSSGYQIPKGWDWRDRRIAEYHESFVEPSEKSEEIESVLTSITGKDRRETILSNLCVPTPVGCGGPAEKFRDDLSRVEYSISGLCQRCQDEVFGSGGQ